MNHPHDDAERAWAASAGSDPSDPWQPPIPIHQRVCPFPIQTAFPEGTEAVRDYCCAIAEAFQVPVDMPAMLITAAAGLAMSQKMIVRLGAEWAQPPNQYNAVLMEPANRKTGPYNEVLQPVLDWERDEGARLAPMIAEENTAIEVMRRKTERFKDLAAGKAGPRQKAKEPVGRDAELAAIDLEKQLAEKKPLSAPQLIASDVTPEELARVMAANGERIGVFSDESEAIDVFLGRYDGKPNIQLYNKGYDGSTHRVNRVSRTPLILKRPLISVGLVIQPEAIRDMLSSRKAKGTGLVARFAMSMPFSLLGHRATKLSVIPPDLRTTWRGTARNLLEAPLEAGREPVEVRLSAEAAGVFDDFCAHIEPSLSWCGEFAAFNMQDWGGKLCGRIGRIALVLHGLKHGRGSQGALHAPISKETVLAAIEWSPYLIEHARAAVGWMGIDDAMVGAKRVLAWIARASRDRFSKQECFTHVRNTQIQLAEDIDRPLQILSDLHYIRGMPDSPHQGRGRPASPEFIVNPRWDRRSV